jgi:adenosylhomocysteine nucleosidase
MSDSNGVINNGSGAVGITNSAFGYLPRSARPAAGSAAPDSRFEPADVGVLTVLGVESRAVVDALAGSRDYRVQEARDGLRFHRATVGAVRVVALQSLHLGQHSAMVAFGQLRERWAPPVIALVGVAGAVHRSVDLGDVVVSDEVVCYETRNQTPDGVLREGRSLQAPPLIVGKLDAFFAEYGEPLWLVDRAGGGFRVRRGPIGSGKAVVANPTSDARTYLAGFDHKLLAVETEAGGVAQAAYEALDQDRPVAGWLTVRGISDRADAREYSYHDAASRHAADVLIRLLPFLAAGGPSG